MSVAILVTIFFIGSLEVNSNNIISPGLASSLSLLLLDSIVTLVKVGIKSKLVKCAVSKEHICSIFPILTSAQDKLVIVVEGSIGIHISLNTAKLFTSIGQLGKLTSSKYSSI